MAKVIFIHSSAMSSPIEIEFIYDISRKEWITDDPNSNFKNVKFKGLKNLPKEVIWS